MWYLLLSAVLVYKVEAGGPATENYKDQFCTDPRTMKKHAAYSEWADAYSCTRHRCQPGGRSLAIYTVGCKRVEAPESAIECEEVVEDTNMQFPYCCTRLRCLVVVRGEVWTRVLGQPWESLPAAPWSHMYKIKKPPPPDASFLNKNAGEGPIYELSPENGEEGKSKKHPNARSLNEDSPQPRNGPAETPDIVIALSTGNENEDKAIDNVNGRRQMGRKHSHTKSEEMTDTENEDNRNGPPSEKSKPHWAQIVPNQWDTENEAMVETENAAKTSLKSQEFFADVQAENNKRGESSENKDEKPLHLQALVDAIGTRMRDIENVVQRMSDKVNPANTIDETKPDYSSEKKYSDRSIIIPQDPDNQGNYRNEKKNGGEKRTNPESELYKRFSSHKRNKYILTSNDPVTEAPLFLEDSQTGYFSGSSNVLRRGIPPKEPSEPAVYMAPVVEARRNNAVPRSRNPEGSEEQENKTKRKRGHKKKKKAINHRKRHHPRELKKSFNQINSSENLISSPENNSSS